MIERLSQRIAAAAVVGCLSLVCGAPDAQGTRVAKDGRRLARAGDSAQQAVTDLTIHVRGMVEDYNSIVYGSAKNPESSYKRLSSHRADVDRKIEDAVRAVEDMNARAEQYFSDWEAELDQYASQTLRGKSVSRLESTRKRYATIAATLAEAREAFAPLLESLDDQLRFLARDLSPGTVADLEPEAVAFNRQAEDVFNTVDGLMAQVQQVEGPAEVVSAD